MSAEPEQPAEDAELGDAEDLVPLGDVLEALDKERAAAATDTARALLGRSRTPPHAMDAERAVLGALLLDAEVCADDVFDTGLRREHFYRQQNGMIFGVIQGLRERREPVDTMTVVDALLLSGELDQVGGAASISQLEALLPTTAHAERYAELVRDKATLREVIRVATDAVSSAYAQDRTAQALVAETKDKLVTLEGTSGTRLRDNAEVVDKLALRIPGLGGVRQTVRSGLPPVDKVLGGGFSPGNLIIIAGRPSMGKTEFVLNVATHLALEERQQVYFASMEMEAEQLLGRVAGKLSSIDIRREHLRVEERQTLLANLTKLRGSLLRIDDNPVQSLGSIRAEARRIARDGNLAAVVVDYLQLMDAAAPTRPGSNPSETTSAAIGVNTKGLKQLARELKVPVLCLSQLNRSLESRQNKRPLMSDLRESGSIEQDADDILFLYRDEYYSKEATPADKVGVAEVIVGKQRNGPAGLTINLRFEGTPPSFSAERRDA